MSVQFQFTVSEYELMQEAAYRADRNIADLVSINKVLNNDVLPNLDLFWTGEAKMVFQMKYQVIQELINQVLKTYSELSEDLKNSANLYQNAELDSITAVKGWR